MIALFGQDWLRQDIFQDDARVSNRPDNRSDGRRSRDRVTVVVREGTEVTIVVRDRSRGRSDGRF